MSSPIDALQPPAPTESARAPPLVLEPDDEAISDRAMAHARAIVPPSILQGTALEDHLTWSADPRNVPEAPPEEEPFAGVPAQVRSPALLAFPDLKTLQYRFLTWNPGRGAQESCEG